VIDLVVLGGTVVTEADTRPADIAVDAGRIVAVGADATALGPARETIDARGLFALPGVIDVHVHFNEPGRTGWEGAATGSRALAAGGGTAFFDMPLNSTPCTVTIDAFERKLEALSASSIADFGIWGGLIPGAVASMEALADRGVVGFKAFLCDSGLAEFPRADERTLLAGLREAARLGLPVAVHAETEELVQRDPNADARDALAWMRSRPIGAEVHAIQRVTEMAGETGAKVHIVHISSGRGVAAALDARRRGVDVSIETCPHYLALTEDDAGRLGTVAKCAPPLRDRATQDDLWSAIVSGDLDIIGSDHSPSEPSLKHTDFASAWGGIAGVQSTLPLVVDRGHRGRGLPLERIASLTSASPARRFGMTNKGRIGVGADADLVLLDLDAPWTLTLDDLLQRHKVSPYVGTRFRARVRRTILRGRTIFRDGTIASNVTPGRFLRPARG
jgi:allantoinase